MLRNELVSCDAFWIPIYETYVDYPLKTNESTNHDDSHKQAVLHVREANLLVAATMRVTRELVYRINGHHSQTTSSAFTLKAILR
jgi:hypothetical protein